MKDKKEEKEIPIFFPTGTLMTPFQEGIGFDPLVSDIGIMRDMMEKALQDEDDLE